MHRTTPRFLLCAVTAFALGATGVQAQGGILWPDSKVTPKAYIVRVAENYYDVYIPGWMTAGSPGTFGDEFVAAGLGVNTGTAREVDKTELKNEADGEPMEGLELFPFLKNLRVKAQIEAYNRTQSWTGFLAKARVPVNGFRDGALVFKFRPVVAIDPALFVRQIQGAMVVVGEADKNGNITNNNRLFKLSVTVAAAEIMYYKFDREVGDFALNYSQRFAGGPRVGKLSSATAWTSGKFKGGLIGGSAASHVSCDTGWKGGLHGDLTVAWFMKQRTAPGSSTSRVFGGPGNLRCFTNGAAGKGIQLNGWSGTTPGLKLTTDVQAKAASGWVHVALVLYTDASRNKKYRWYVDGAKQNGGTLPKYASIPFAAATNTFVIGGTSGDPSFYDIDEFRLWGSAVSEIVVKRWANAPTAATGRHGYPKGCALRSNSLPALGNSNYKLQVFGSPSTTTGIVIGAPVPTPFLLAGSLVYVSPIVVHWIAKTDNKGRYDLGLPIPNQPSLKGALAYSQAYQAVGAKLKISNAHASSLQ